LRSSVEKSVIKSVAVRGKRLWQVSIETTSEAEDAVTELLGRVFNRPAAIYTNEETKLTIASVYCERRDELTAVKRAALQEGLQTIRATGLNVGLGTIFIRPVAREDWAESWKRHFKAIEIGPRLLVKPGWVKRRPRKGQAVVVLDPGLSFGTGNHPTTAFCLRALADFRKPGQKQTFLDIGTGSGILAIAAAKLGYTPVRAMDFDAEAVRVARQNARRNRVHFVISQQDITKLPSRSRVKYDFICANLISNLLLAEMRRITGRLQEGGALALAGILKEEFREIERACRKAGLYLSGARTEGEWRSGVFLFRRTPDAGRA
jgi:ribosomal protein L11 methyltransferase